MTKFTKFIGNCAVCSGSHCTSKQMTKTENLMYGGAFKECNICYLKVDAENCVQRGCAEDIPCSWHISVQHLEEVPNAGSACYPLGKGVGSEICFCKGYRCNLSSFESLGGNFKYDPKKITCNCPREKCLKDRSNKFKCYKPRLLPVKKCDCLNCDCQ